jgi:hypothetical protein
MIAITAALFIGLALGAWDTRRHQRRTETLLVESMRANTDAPYDQMLDDPDIRAWSRENGWADA